MPLDFRLASILYSLVLVREFWFSAFVPDEQDCRGSYIVDLCLPFILPFTSFVVHFIHHLHIILQINQSIITTCATLLMPVEVCRVHSTIDCDWVPLFCEGDVPGFKQRPLTSSDTSCQKGNLVSKEDLTLVTINWLGSSCCSWRLQCERPLKKIKNSSEPSVIMVIMQYKEKKRV